MSAVHEERTARAAWSALVEPGDAVAAALVAMLGPVEAWARVERALRAYPDGHDGVALVLGVDDRASAPRRRGVVDRPGPEQSDDAGASHGRGAGVGAGAGAGGEACARGVPSASAGAVDGAAAAAAAGAALAAGGGAGTAAALAAGGGAGTAAALAAGGGAGTAAALAAGGGAGTAAALAAEGGAGTGAAGDGDGDGAAGAGAAGAAADADMDAGRGPARARLARALARWAPRAATLDVSRQLEALDSMGGTFLVPGDGGWPRMLDALGPAAPFGLWVRGSADVAGAAARSVAVVGARAATTYGERVAHDLAGGLADRGVAVVSGGAFGIDAAAHRGALARSGRTLVVLAGGVDRAYPRGNARLLKAVVAEGGSILSEVPVGSAPTRVRFLQRNRLIAGLGAATVVVEAAWRSGAISTAYHAAGLLRPVGVVPGPVTSVASAGCHRLLRSGLGVCVTDTAEVLELAGLDGPVPDPRDVRVDPGDGLPEHVRRVLDATSWRRPLEPVALAASAGVSVADVRGALGLLELDGLVRRDGAGWRRARS